MRKPKIVRDKDILQNNLAKGEERGEESHEIYGLIPLFTTWIEHSKKDKNVASNSKDKEGVDGSPYFEADLDRLQRDFHQIY